MFSKIGNSILEIYVPSKDIRDIVGKIEAKDVKLNPGYNPNTVPEHSNTEELQMRMEAKAIKRVAFLYRRAWLKNLKECIFEGFDESFRTKVLNEITTTREQRSTQSEAAALIKPASNNTMDIPESGW
jgi:hypothetical protein